MSAAPNAPPVEAVEESRLVRLGLHVPAASGARVDLMDDVLVDIGDGQDLRESLSTFSVSLSGCGGRWYSENSFLRCVSRRESCSGGGRDRAAPSVESSSGSPGEAGPVVVDPCDRIFRMMFMVER